jgi:hypothetical protein
MQRGGPPSFLMGHYRQQSVRQNSAPCCFAPPFVADIHAGTRQARIFTAIRAPGAILIVLLPKGGIVGADRVTVS